MRANRGNNHASVRKHDHPGVDAAGRGKVMTIPTLASVERDERGAQELIVAHRRPSAADAGCHDEMRRIERIDRQMWLEVRLLGRAGANLDRRPEAKRLRLE